MINARQRSSLSPSRLLTDKVTNKMWNISQILIKLMRHHTIVGYAAQGLWGWQFWWKLESFTGTSGTSLFAWKVFPFMFFIKRQKSFIKIIKQKNAFVTLDCVPFCLSFWPQSLSTCRLCVPTWDPDFLTWMELERLINRYDQIWSWEFSLKGQALGLEIVLNYSISVFFLSLIDIIVITYKWITAIKYMGNIRGYNIL